MSRKYADQMYCEWVGIQQSKIVGMHMMYVLTESAYLMAKPNIDKVLSGLEVNFEAKVPQIILM